MAKITSASIEKVRDAADMVEVVGARTDLRRQGARWTGLCPFHPERTPSFSVNPSDKLYYCFGCEASGDIFTFVQETEEVSFAEAVEWLSQRFGVEIEREAEDPGEAEARQRRERLGSLLERAAQYYANYLWQSPKAEKVRSYLASRGLGEEVLGAFGVGYSPSDWGALLSRAQQAGFSVEELVGAGLARQGRHGGHYDAFRARIVFPVRDRRGRVLGFGARATRGEQKPKYVNSAETDLFRKSEMLYGIDQARAPIAKAGRAVLVEGYTDVLALHQAGITETVGVMGTAITDRQVATLAGLTGELILCLDADSAGREAMLRAQRIASNRRLRLRVASMPGGRDPAEVVAEDGGAERFGELLDRATGVEEFQVELILAEADPGSPESRDATLARLAPVLGSMQEGAVRAELERRAAERLDLDPRLIARRADRDAGTGEAAAEGREPAEGGEGARAGGGGGRSGATVTPRERHERALLAMCIEDPGPGRQTLERLTREHMSSDAAWRAVEWLRENLESPLEGLPREDEELAGLIRTLVMQATPPEEGSLGAGYEPASSEAIEVNFLLLEQRRLEAAITEAGRQGDQTRRSELIRERAGIGQRLRELGTPGISIGAPPRQSGGEDR